MCVVAYRWSVLVLTGCDSGEIGGGTGQDRDGLEAIILCLNRKRKREK